jgi:branched-chain amino acid transport system permease protein
VTRELYFLLIGLGVGSVYALASLSITMLFKGSGLLNFAQGEFMMVGALTAVMAVDRGVPYGLAVVVALVATVVVAVLVGALFTIPLRRPGYDIDLVILGTLGVAIVLSNGAAVVGGRDTDRLASPLGGVSVSLGDLQIPAHYFAVMAGAALFVCAIAAVYQRTDLGLRLRAVALDTEAARSSGLAIGPSILATWVLTGVACGLGGALVGSIIYVNAYVGLGLTINGLAGAMVGGLLSPTGAVVGGLIIGVAETFAGGYLSGSMREIVAPALILAVMLFRPQGLFASRVAARAV